MKVVKAARVEDFLPYVSGTRLSQTMQRHVALFLAKLSGVSDPATVRHICIEEKAWFEQQYSNDNTRAAHMTKYRRAITSMAADRTFPESVLYEQETQNGPVLQHIALKWMNYSSEFHQQRQAPTQKKAKAQRRERVAFQPQPVINAAVSALSSESTWEVAAAIILLTGRRPTEILKSAEFKQAGPYQLEFSGQLKRRDNEAVTYSIYCLERSHRLIDAFTRFRRIASVRELQEAENAVVDSKLNAIVNRAVRAVFPEDVLPAPYGEPQLSAKNLRAAYTNIAYHLFSQPQTSISSFAEDFLGHQNAASAANYEDYYCVDTKGQPLAVGLLRDELEAKPKRPKARKRTTVHVDGLLKERFEAYGSGTHKEKMAQLLDAAERNEQLECRLHSVEQRLKLAQDHIALLKEQKQQQAEVIATSTKQKKRSAILPRRGSANSPSSAAVTSSPDVKQKKGVILQGRGSANAPAHTPIPDDWTEMSNAELNGSQIPGSADEKIRRSIEAFYAYNEEREFAEQWSITPTVIQKLSGSNANRVKSYLLSHSEVAKRLERYNHDYGYQQNRGKGNPRETVKWPARCGDYEW